MASASMGRAGSAADMNMWTSGGGFIDAMRQAATQQQQRQQQRQQQQAYQSVYDALFGFDPELQQPAQMPLSEQAACMTVLYGYEKACVVAKASMSCPIKDAVFTMEKRCE